MSRCPSKVLCTGSMIFLSLWNNRFSRLSNTSPVHTNLEIFETAYLFTRIRVDGSLARGRGRGGFQVTGMIEWGKKIKTPKNILTKIEPPKNPSPNFRPIKNFQKALNDLTITNLRIVLNTPKNAYLNQAAPNFPTQKNPEMENFKSKKNPFIIYVTWSPEYPLPPGGFRPLWRAV